MICCRVAEWISISVWILVLIISNWLGLFLIALRTANNNNGHPSTSPLPRRKFLYSCALALLDSDTVIRPKNMPPRGKLLEERLAAAGSVLLQPPSSADELLPRLDEIEELLSKVEQSPAKSMRDALSPVMDALVAEKLLKHSDGDVKVSVASCISEITRITAPEAPYDNDVMKDVLQLIVSSFENFADTSSRSHKKRVTVLKIMAKARSCVVLLDLGCDRMVVEMFQYFLKAIRDFHTEVIFGYMETIMSLVLEESEDISSDLLGPILATLKRTNKAVLPIAKKLAVTVIQNTVGKIRPYLTQAMKSLGASVCDFDEVVAILCQEDNGSEKHDILYDFYQLLATVQPKSEVHKEAVNVASPIQTDSFTNESQTNEASLDKRKGNSISRERVSLDTVSHKLSEGESVSVANKQSCLGKKQADVGQTLTDKGTCSIDDECASDSVAKSLDEIERLGDASDKMEDSSSLRKVDGRKSGRGRPSLESIARKESRKDIVMSSKEVPKSSAREDNKRQTMTSLKAAREPGILEESRKVNPKRKRTPDTRKVSEIMEAEEDLIGSKVQVWRPKHQMFLEGIIVASFSSGKKKYQVLFANGEEELLDLKSERWELVKDDTVSEAHPVMKSPTSEVVEKIRSILAGGPGQPAERFFDLQLFLLEYIESPAAAKCSDIQELVQKMVHSAGEIGAEYDVVNRRLATSKDELEKLSQVESRKSALVTEHADAAAKDAEIQAARQKLLNRRSELRKLIVEAEQEISMIEPKLEKLESEARETAAQKTSMEAAIQEIETQAKVSSLRMIVWEDHLESSKKKLAGLESSWEWLKCSWEHIECEQAK
ncbi:sister chromatid cohesion protein PDS5 homolog C-like [Andrographis paniculata]|uniref:sister chromatid cohesion protein PDS5 homolog C-like n=1 Tax=Andrographis paniculata TaxID=175694 RepID=UPI0021E8A07E|nr:sister chromatid cohesion protein PDS5 homolog C-like [Andrographis paniculata]